jgi:rare lipoprotein A
VGLASWYGPGFHGRRTANGERFNQYALTAAHRSLPMGTKVEVTNLSNGRQVEVRINDRGPYVGPRVIDLSYGTARALGMLGSGTARVRLERLMGDSLSDTPSSAYAVSVGAYASRDRAENLRALVERRARSAATLFQASPQQVYVVDRAATHEVRVGPFGSEAEAKDTATALASAELPAKVVKEVVAKN